MLIQIAQVDSSPDLYRSWIDAWAGDIRKGQLFESSQGIGNETAMSERPLRDGIDGIVFDAVGTLIKPEPSVAATYTAAARSQGVELGTEEVRARFHVHFQSDAVHGEQGVLSTDEATERRRWRRIVAGVLPEIPDPDRAFDELWEHFSSPRSWRCFPDVVPTMKALKEMGVSLCVGSNFDGRLRGVVQGLPELASWVDSLVISSEVGYRKPHPSFFRAACDHLGLPPERVMCVGDDVENDVRGAIRAGLLGLLLDRGAERPADLPHVANLTALVQSRFNGG
jgi:putative hydrolase of the HAD superfamily